MKTFSFELKPNNLTQRITHDGVKYLSSPVVPIRQGVLNGELVLNEEISRFVDAWNGIPLPIGHPEKEGVPISAQTPDLVAQSLGRLWNASFDDHLGGSLWIDIERANKTGYGWLITHIEEGKPVEVSTGYFRDVETSAGVYDDIEYQTIARNIRPDHLALLPNGRGACSWSDGCGTPRTNADQDYSDSAMIALYPSPEDGEVLAMDHPNALPPSHIHLTLAYLGKIADQSLDQGPLLEILSDVARWQVVVQGSVNGLVRFRGEEQDAYCWTFDSPQLKELMRFLRWVEDAGYTFDKKHLFKPHITRTYLEADESTPPDRPDKTVLTFKRLGLSWGEQTIYFELQGEALQMNTEEINELIGNAVREAVKPLEEQITEMKPVFKQASEIVANQQAREEAERKTLVDTLVANDYNAEELKSISTATLIKMSSNGRQAYYGGRPAPATATNATTESVPEPRRIVTKRGEA